MKKNKLDWYSILSLITIVIITFASLIYPVTNTDETTFAIYGDIISKGKVPYKDISLICTPLSYYIMALWSKLFGSRLITYRILSIIIYSVIFVKTNNRIKRLVNNNIGILISSITFILIIPDIRFEYNIMIVLLTLFILDVEESKIRCKHLLIGILAGLCAATKQTTGIIIIAASVISVLAYENISIKEKIKNILYRLSGVAIIGIIGIVYLLATNTWNDFFDFCLYGSSSFINNINIISIKEMLLVRCLHVIGIIITIIYYSINFKKSVNNRKINFIYGVAALFCALPLLDYWHLNIAIIVILPLMCKIAVGKIRITKYSNLCGILMLIIIIEFTFMSDKIVVDDTVYIENIDRYKYCKTTTGMMKLINEVNDYIEKSDTEVYILDGFGSVFFMCNGDYHKYYDVILQGNYGTKTIDELIQQAYNDNATILLPNNEKALNWQVDDSMYDCVNKYYTIVEKMKYRYNVYKPKIN